jgi:hypothetical protein
MRRTRAEIAGDKKLTTKFRHQPLARAMERFVLLGEVKTNVTMLRFAEEAGTGHSGDADGFGDLFRRDAIIREAQRRDVDECVVGALGNRVIETGLREIAEEEIALAGVFGE